MARRIPAASQAGTARTRPGCPMSLAAASAQRYPTAALARARRSGSASRGGG